MTIRPFTSQTNQATPISASIDLLEKKGRKTPISSAIRVLQSAGINAGVCAMAASTFSIVSPGTAAIFGAASSLARNGIRSMMGKNDRSQGVRPPFSTRIATSVITYATASATAALVLKAAALPITFQAAVKLTAAMYLTSFAIMGLAMGCLCCCALAVRVGFPSAK